MERKARLEGKVAIVTGAGSSGPGIGNGRATAVLLAREGARVLLVDLFEDRAKETQAMVAQEGGVASVCQADVTRGADCQRMVEAALQQYGRLDVLVNNVGISKRGTVLDVTEEEWDRVMAVNVKSMVLSSRHAIPAMKRTGGGSIINISSTGALRAHGHTPYSASKAAVLGLTMSMAVDHGPDNIRVNAIAPGRVYTPMVAPRMDPEVRRQRVESNALRTEGTGWDVGWAAVYLASDESRWVTGITLPVDAGMLAKGPGTGAGLRQQEWKAVTGRG